LANTESMEVPAAELDQLVQSDPQAKQLGIELGKKIALIYGDERPDSELKTQDADRHRKELKMLQEQYDQRVESIQKKVQQSRRQTIAKEVLRLQTLLSTMQQQQESVVKNMAKMQSQVEMLGTSSVAVEMLRSDLKHMETSLEELSSERDKVRVSLRDAPRISLVEKAEAVEN
jgi:hypothetical protein